MTDILVCEDVRGPGLDELRERYDVAVEPDLWRDEGALARRLAGCRGLIVRNQTRVDRTLIEAVSTLQVVGRAGAGLDNIDVAAATNAGVRVCYAPEQNALSVAEHVMALMLALARRVVPADRSTRSGGWERQRFTGIELHGRTLGLIGFGRIGFLTAMRGRAFGMEVLAHDPFISPDAVTLVEAGARLVDLETLLQRSDVVSCHLPATAETRGLMNATRFGSMKTGALFLNLARGEVVDEDALVDALRDGPLAAAGLDVRSTEPPGPSRLDDLDNVVLTPHIAAFTGEAQDRVLAAVCRDVAAVLEGRQPVHPASVAPPANGTT